MNPLVTAPVTFRSGSPLCSTGNKFSYKYNFEEGRVQLCRADEARQEVRQRNTIENPVKFQNKTNCAGFRSDHINKDILSC